MATDFPNPVECAQTLLIQGADALSFAQAQFSSDIQLLEPGHWQFSAWLNPQGRVKWLFQLARLDDQTLLLLLRGGSADAFKQALQRFLFRSRVQLDAACDRFIADGPALPLHTLQRADSFHRDRECLTWGSGDHSIRLVADHPETDHWRLRQIQLGWPWLPQKTLDGDMLPTAISLMRLQGASLEKGCYPGQEIVARLHYRGGSKRHMHSICLTPGATAGVQLRTHDGHPIVLLNIHGTEAQSQSLAVMPDSALTGLTSDSTLRCEGDMTARIVRSWPD